ncbi:hypothetical protein [Burkholderia plantarii]|uniref:hypothetical protein n=1 Tax=Burkholderia plantarii TaxID=41899 RepID=UPI000ACEE863|nr:hypothetical protein [Burkholderia plantarii]
MSNISIIGAGGMAAAIGGLAVKAGHTVEMMSRDVGKARTPEHACMPWPGLMTHSVEHASFPPGVSLPG